MDRVYIPCNVQNNHWSLFSLDVWTETITYGDSMAGQCPPADLAAVKRWLSKHFEPTLWKFAGTMTIGEQPDDDAVSCGVIVINAIKHATFGDALWTEEARDTIRLQEYLDLVADDVAEKVSSVVTASNQPTD